MALGAGAAWIALVFLHGAANAHGNALPAAIAIWVLMSVAMMLPTAAPAIDIYVHLPRRIKARRAAHLAAFAGGFLAAWSGFSVIAASLQIALGSMIAAGTGSLPLGILAGVLLLMAGIYQLTPLKQACLTKYRNPLTFFISHWRDGIGGAARIGLHHGAICVGCCWAPFGLMFLLGVANLSWMAALGLVMLLERPCPATCARVEWPASQWR